MNSKRIMNEIFRVAEATDPRQAEDELNNSQSVFGPPKQASGTPSTDPRVKKAQDQLNTARPVVKREALNWESLDDQRLLDELVQLADIVPKEYRESVSKLIGQVVDRFKAAKGL